MAELPNLIAANERYLAGFTKGDLPSPPSRKIVVLTCLDARLNPAKFLGLEEGDAHIIRNAGGRATDDVLRSMIISYKLLGTREFFVIHHTDCGMLKFTNEQLREMLRRDMNVDASGIDFLPFSDAEESVRQDIQTIRSSPFILDDISINGLIFDVKTGRLSEV